ncbi:MAG TPA: hypothetical protein VMD53_02980 [Rhizomicrobium sp.]|nr:hypothetical protein [Rhizomicrobium sp.]
MPNTSTRTLAQLSTRYRSASLLGALAVAALVPLATAVMPEEAEACACGCGVFDVGANILSAMPSGANGASVWFRYDYMDQDQNWEHGSKAPASDNQDKDINTSFYTVGGEYEINQNWTVLAELPVYGRQLETTDDGTVFGPAGGVYTGHLTDLGDMQLAATYTGFAPDQSSGVMFGVKLPTGNYTGPNGPLGGSEFDRDSLPGTGSTDLMLGGYHTGDFGAIDALSYFVDGKYQAAVLTRDSYRPGNEFDAAAGLSYDFGKAGPLDDFAGVLQFINSYRMHDTGANADPLNSGYERVLIAPGFTLQLHQFRVFADIEVPIHQYTNAASSVAIEGTSGQLVASTLYKFQVAYDF